MKKTIKKIKPADLDLTRSRAEQSRRNSELRFRSLIENASDLVLILNPDYTIAYVSPSVERILGHTVAAVTGAKLTDFVDAQDLPALIAATEHRARTPGPSPFPMQVRVRHADGSWRILEGMGNNLLDRPGVSGLVINARDITESKRAEEAFRESEDRYRDLVENSQDLICTHDLNGQILSANPRAEKMLGYERTALLQMNFRDILAPEALPGLAAYLRRISKRGAALGLMIVQTKTGERRIWEYNNTLRTEGVSVPIVRGMARDVTERKRAEEIVRQQSEQLGLLYKASQRLNCTLDLNEINQAICDFMSIMAPNDGFVISNFDPETQLITCRAFWMENNWLDVSAFPPIPLEADGKGTQSIVIRTGQSMLLNDYQAQVKTAQTSYVVNGETNVVSKEIPPDEEITRSALIVPLKSGGMVTGVIQVMSYHLNAYTENQLKLLEALALHIASAEQNALLYARVQTELNERKQAEEEIKKQLDELQRWHDATLGRETRILDLKREVNELLGQAGKPLRYPSAET